MQKLLAVTALLMGSGMPLLAQSGNSAVTQILVGVDTQANRVPALSDITLKANGKSQQLTGWSQVPADQLQIAILIDNNRLKHEVGDHLDSLRDFATSLPAGAQLYIGYMTAGGIETVQPFTRNHDRAASRFRRPSGLTEQSPGPFACVSKFVGTWSSYSSRSASRFILLLTDGIDYRPAYADSATEDAQRAGVAVYAVYLHDGVPPDHWDAQMGFKLRDSPIEALDKVTGGTGGHAYYEQREDQLPLAVYLDRFRNALASTYVASFVAPSAGSKLLQLKVETKLPGGKLTAPKAVMPGNVEITSVK